MKTRDKGLRLYINRIMVVGLLLFVLHNMTNASQRGVIINEQEYVPTNAGRDARANSVSRPAKKEDSAEVRTTERSLVSEMAEAIRLGNASELRQFLLKASSKEKVEALRRALIAKNANMVDLVVRSGIGEITLDRFDYLLYLAVKSDDAENVRALMGGNLITDLQWQQQSALLELARKNGNKEIISILEKNSGNKRGATAGP